MPDHPPDTALSDIEIPPSIGERRERLRRQEDLNAGSATWIDWLLKNKARWAFIFTLLGALLTGVTAFATNVVGVRLLGPNQDTQSAERRALLRDSIAREQRAVIAKRVDALEVGAQATSRDISDIKSDMRLWTFIQCTQMRTTNPELLPPDCAPIIRSRRR